MEASQYQTVEAMANWIALMILRKQEFDAVKVYVKKLSVFGHADGPGVQIKRKKMIVK